MSGRRRVGYVLVTLVAAACAIVATAGPAVAHASLVEASPTQGSVVADQPSSVRLTFNEPVEVTVQAIRIVGPDGKAVEGLSPGIDPHDGDSLVVALPKSLPDGTYAVSWRVLSVDGHPVEGQF
ncbi:MAG: copper resistance CopC family protein [Sporichthyaceae bacterium]